MSTISEDKKAEQELRRTGEKQVQLAPQYTNKGGARMLNVGDKAPDFEVLDHEGKAVRMSDYDGMTVVLWFYPRASTGD